MANLSIEEIPLGDPRLREFVEAPWHIYRGDPYWTPPLKADLLGNKLLGLDGLLTPEHPYHRDAEVTHFLARRGSEPVGSVSAAINRRFNEYHHTRIGFFGFFETVEDFEVAQALLDAARDWVKQRGMEILRGPGQYSNATHERQGVLVWGFDRPPTVELTHNPPYYGPFLERYGFHKAKDYHAYELEVQTPVEPRLERLAERARARRNIETRMVNMKAFDEEVRLLVRIYNEAWAQNWGFLPLTNEEADALAESLRPVLDPPLLRFATVEGEPAAVFGGLPDLYVPLRPRWRWPHDTDWMRLARVLLQRRHIPRMRLMFFGVRPAFRRTGVDAVIFLEAKKYAMARGYQWCETSMLLEDNDLIRNVSAHMGGRHYKTWRIYDMEL
jgi:GNAT superfamily N-acetyltransferase